MMKQFQQNGGPGAGGLGGLGGLKFWKFHCLQKTSDYERARSGPAAILCYYQADAPKVVFGSFLALLCKSSTMLGCVSSKIFILVLFLHF